MIKGIAILMVVLLHSIPGDILYKTFAFLWLGQAVPLFILIQVYHIKNSFVSKGRKLSYFYSWYTLLKLLRRIIFPFCLFLSVQIVIFYALGELNWKEVLSSGGIGPGSYYIYIYLEIAFLAPLIYYWMRNWSKIAKFLMFIVLSEALELLCSYSMIPDYLYRLLFFRYFFLIYLGFQIDLKDIRLNFFKISLAIIGIIFIITDLYTDANLMPFIYHTAWRGYHWLAYFYTAYVFIYFLKHLYHRISEKIQDFLCFIGLYSYEIFLLQMFVFGFDRFLNISSNSFTFMLLFFVKIILSILPVFLLWKRGYGLYKVFTK